MPRINIFIPVFNTDQYLAETIESVIAQSYTEWDLLILDDCSSDNSYQIALEYSVKDQRISVRRNEKNLGMLDNWNLGISLCQAEYFVKLDADDRWHPDFLTESIRIMDSKSEVAMVFTKYLNIDDRGNIITGSESIIPDFARDSSFYCVPLVQMGAAKMLQYNILRQGVSLIRRRVIEEIGAYRYLLTHDTLAATDTEFYFRVGCHYPIYVINKTLYEYRVHTASISARDSQSDLSAKKLYEVKSTILNYYYEQKKIGKTLWLSSIKDTQFRFNSYLFYRYRITKRYRSMLKVLFKNVIIDPFRALNENLHLDRLLRGRFEMDKKRHQSVS